MTTTVYIILGVVVLLLIGLVVLLVIRNKKAKAAAAGGSAEAAGSDEISLLIRAAEAKLSAAKLESGARVGNLPALLLVGEPGTTKTSVMLHSGIEAELLAGQVYQNNEVASTRSANLWFARRMLFVEAGGSLLADSGQWRTLIKKLQPRASVVSRGEQAARAAVVFFDCENFTRQGALEAASASARNLRARLGEISQALGINLPVYVLFTRIDRLPFCLEYIRNLNNEEASQVLGVTLPMVTQRAEGVYGEQETARLSENFERLFRSLADSRPEFLARETDASKLPPAYEFPREFRKLRPAAVQFLVDLCRPSQLTTGPFLRGFYFTGVRPVIINESAPVAAAAHAEPQASYDAPPGATGIFSAGARAQAQRQTLAPPTTGSRKVPQWVFLTHLFNDILLADKSAMGASGASTKTSSARRILFLAAASLCLLASIFFTVSFFKNRGLEAQVSDAARGISTTAAPGGDLASTADLRKLDTLRQALERLTTYHRDGAPLGYRLGLFTGDDLYPEARRIYFARFQQLLLLPTQRTIVPFLDGLPPKPGPEYSPTYDALKAYLITTSNHDKSTLQFLPPVLMKWWKNDRTVDDERTLLAQKQFDFYAGELKDENPFTNLNDGAAVAHARNYLSQFAGADRVYAFMLSEAGKNNPPIDFNRQFADSAKIVVEPHVVPGAFSKGGWAFMKDAVPHADRYFSGEEWVLGKQQAGSLDRAALEQEIRSRYNKDFTEEWRKYIKSAAVQRYTGVPDAAQKLGVTSGAQSPLLALLCVASENTSVDDPAVAAVFQPVQTVVPAGCTAKYNAPSNQNYMASLLTLQASLEAISSQPAPSEAAAAPTLTNATQARLAARQVAQAFRADSDLGAPVQKLLEDPITNAEGVLRGLGPADLNKKGKDTCAQLRPILSKFPFNPKSQADATIQEVNSIFAPKQGAIWQFYEASLQKLVSRQGVPVPGAPIQITPLFQNYLAKVSAFTDAAYPNGAANPQLKYSVRGVIGPDTERITGNIDGQNADFLGANAAAKVFMWPGPSPGMQLAIRLKGGNEALYPSYQGLWAVFRFVGDADRHLASLVEMDARAGRTNQLVRNPVNNQPVTIKLEITSNPPVFDKGYFASIGCVSEVAKQ
jgi:type VI secretion system protein ImpL